MADRKPIPIIDLFAGPGGLGEGFSSVHDEHGSPVFSLRVSVEKDEIAHQTLSLRALFRKFPKGKAPECYYDHIRGHISRQELFAHPKIKEAAGEALEEAKCAELGKDSPEEIDGWIKAGLEGASDWVLIGGPPCQAYSLAGRSRRTRESQEKFESDEKHFLYREYLRIIRRFAPTVFVMENVKGMLSSTHGGSPIFDRIIKDLSHPGPDLSYEIRSLVVPGTAETLEPQDFVIEAERFGVPQGRHRVILFGVRFDAAKKARKIVIDQARFTLQNTNDPVSVGEALSGLPPIRSKISRGKDSREEWLAALNEAPSLLSGWNPTARAKVESAMRIAAQNARSLGSAGEPFIKLNTAENQLNRRLSKWLLDPRIGGVIQHESRSHMRSDLHRYLFASAYAAQFGFSPKVTSFPPLLLPDHGNVTSEKVPFTDRFRVQTKNTWSSTVVAHIAKDGHYFIHYDPSQCRSLTVREAARLQTFPDNYFFAGNRTEQYTQVGNAVPPWLARRIATVVADFMNLRR